jgi:hypothetical protein
MAQPRNGLSQKLATIRRKRIDKRNEINVWISQMHESWQNKKTYQAPGSSVELYEVEHMLGHLKQLWDEEDEMDTQVILAYNESCKDNAYPSPPRSRGSRPASPASCDAKPVVSPSNTSSPLPESNLFAPSPTSTLIPATSKTVSSTCTIDTIISRPTCEWHFFKQCCHEGVHNITNEAGQALLLCNSCKQSYESTLQNKQKCDWEHIYQCGSAGKKSNVRVKGDGTKVLCAACFTRLREHNLSPAHFMSIGAVNSS